MSFPVFATGDILAASDMNAVGLWKITGATATFTGGTAGSVSNGTVTIGTTNTAVTVNNAFSADYDNYLIFIAGGVSSATNVLRMTLGAAATGYYYGGKGRTYAAADINTEGSNVAFWYAGEGSVNSLSAVIDVRSPFLAKNTLFSTHIDAARTDGYHLNVGGYLANTTSYTAFTITCSAGSITGGTIRVYGYRN